MPIVCGRKRPRTRLLNGKCDEAFIVWFQQPKKSGPLLFKFFSKSRNISHAWLAIPVDFLVPFSCSITMSNYHLLFFSSSFECVCVLDLDKLTTSQLSRKSLAIIKEQAAIDSVCFPETMAKMLIINAPTFFAATWRIIKGWLDPRTAAKIEVISSRSACEKRLAELADLDQLPSDYGGTGPSTEEILAKSSEGTEDKFETTMMYVRGHGSEVVNVPANMNVQVTVHTRSTAGASFTLTNADTKDEILPEVLVKHNGTDDVTERPSHTILNAEKTIAGPLKVKVKVDSKAGRFSTQNFLLVVSFYKNK